MKIFIFSGKTATSSVPSISIKFHANAEEIEELYPSDEDVKVSNEDISAVSAGHASIGELQCNI